MRVHIDKVEPFLGEVSKSWLATSRAPTSKSSPKELMTNRHYKLQDSVEMCLLVIKCIDVKNVQIKT